VREEHFIDACKKRGITSLSKSFTSNPLYRVPDEKIQKLRNKVNALMDGNSSLKADEIEKDVIHLLFDCFENSEVMAEKSPCTELAKAVDYIVNNREKPITVKALCSAIGASERTLRYQFKSRYNIGPNHFIKAVRLNALYKALQEKEQNEPIYRVAGNLGFWHMGQLAKDFKALFGISPSAVVS
jgi:AraC family ethanolamine operon transcriptional activator